MLDLTPSQFADLAAQIAKLNNIDPGLAKDIVVASGDAFKSVGDDGLVEVTLPDGTALRVIWPEDF